MQELLTPIPKFKICKSEQSKQGSIWKTNDGLIIFERKKNKWRWQISYDFTEDFTNPIESSQTFSSLKRAHLDAEDYVKNKSKWKNQKIDLSLTKQIRDSYTHFDVFNLDYQHMYINKTYVAKYSSIKSPIFISGTQWYYTINGVKPYEYILIDYEHEFKSKIDALKYLHKVVAENLKELYQTDINSYNQSRKYLLENTSLSYDQSNALWWTMCLKPEVNLNHIF